jgi:Transposase DDE domain
LHKQTPEPVFGIIKSTLGFRQFLLRGLRNVQGEWTLVTMCWNLKRMFTRIEDGRRSRERSLSRTATSTSDSVLAVLMSNSPNPTPTPLIAATALIIKLPISLLQLDAIYA